MGLYKDRGVVIGGFRLGEADKIVTLVSEGRGLVRAVAKGVRKTKSRFGGRLEPLGHVSVLVYEGRSLDVISQAETISAYPRLRECSDRLATGLGLAEAASRVAPAGEPAPRLYRLLVAGLVGLEALRPAEPVPPLYLTAFLLRVMHIGGFAMAATACAACGADGGLDRFGIAEGGALCDRCASPTAYRVRREALALIGRLSDGRLAETASEAGRPPNGAEAAALVRRFVEYHLDIRLRAPAVAAQL